MNKNTQSVEHYISHSYLKEVKVKIKKGITIILFAVSMETMAMPCFDTYTPIDNTAELIVSGSENSTSDGSGRENTSISLSLCDNPISVSDKLRASLMNHRGSLMSVEQMESFNQLASLLQGVVVKDVLVRYNETDHHVSYDLLLNQNLILHLTQYFDQPTDQLVYSVERENQFIKAGYAPFERFDEFIKEVVDEAIPSL